MRASRQRLFRGIALAATLASASCTQYWAKPGGTKAEFEATESGCESQSYMQFPPMMQQMMISAGYTTPIQTSCSGTGYVVNCFTTGGQYIPPAYMPVDQNRSARDSAVRSCLFSAGWQPVKDKAEAEAVNNSAAYKPPVNPVVLRRVTSNAKVYCDNIFQKNNVDMMVVFENNYDRCMSTRTRELSGTR